MSITDELREWSKNWSATNRSLDDIADRIDKAARKYHEARCADCMLVQDKVLQYDLVRADKDRLRNEIAENYIELPKDKNGKVIHIGDEVVCGGNRRTIAGISSEGAFVSRSICKDTTSPYIFFTSNKYELIEYDTQEKIDRDAQSLFDCNVDVTPEIIQDLLRRQRYLDGAK